MAKEITEKDVVTMLRIYNVSSIDGYYIYEDSGITAIKETFEEFAKEKQIEVVAKIIRTYKNGMLEGNGLLNIVYAEYKELKK